MENEMQTTFRLVDIDNPTGNFGMTAGDEMLARRAPGNIQRNSDTRLAMERTDWIDKGDRMAVNRSIILAIEDKPGEWKIGAEATASWAD
jgi:hypothetical protein